MSALVDAYDGLIIDLWGVLHDGFTVYPGVLDALARLAKADKRTVLLSNSPRRAVALDALLRGLGIERSLYDHVVSSGEVTHAMLARRDDPWFAALGHRCLHIGPPRDLPLTEGLGLTLTTLDDAEFVLNTGPDGPHEKLEHYIPTLRAAAARRLPMVCANPDRVVMVNNVREICAGTLADYYVGLGAEVRWVGKPDPMIYTVCQTRLGIIQRQRILAVGDAFITDMAGAAAAGLDGLFVTGGIHAEELGTPPDPVRLQALARSFGLRPVAAIAGFVW